MTYKRYSIFLSKDNKTGQVSYAFEDAQAEAEMHGTRLYCFPNGCFLTIENAADAITVCSLLNQIEKTSSK
jgi:hypothetical protein